MILLWVSPVTTPDAVPADGGGRQVASLTLASRARRSAGQEVTVTPITDLLRVNGVVTQPRSDAVPADGGGRQVASLTLASRARRSAGQEVTVTPITDLLRVNGVVTQPRHTVCGPPKAWCRW